jgi:DNA (cytosine-5)-methyltransferase 1
MTAKADTGDRLRDVAAGQLSSVEICAGAGGQALGLEQAGFAHQGLVELDADACQTLRRNRGTQWRIIRADLAEVDGRAFAHADLLSGGVPCPPFSVAGKQLGSQDERDLFPQTLRLIEQASPRAVLLENVPGLAARRFDGYRTRVLQQLHALGYQTWWDLVHASDHGVPQLRPRFVLVAIRPPWAARFGWPKPAGLPVTVGEALGDLMGSRGWPGAPAWSRRAGRIAPTIVGGSTRHGGPDLGPTRARQAWKHLGVDGRGIADHAPGPADPDGQPPRLTIRMVAGYKAFPIHGNSPAAKPPPTARSGTRSRPQWPGRWAQRSPPRCQAITHAPKHPPAAIASIVMNTERPESTPPDTWLGWPEARVSRYRQ